MFEGGERSVQVLLDDQIFLRQQRGGVSRYFAELWRESQHSSDCRLVADFRWHTNDHARHVGLPGYVGLNARKVPKILQMANRVAQKRWPAEISHHTYYDLRYMQRSRADVKAITVYDMIPELFPDLFGGGDPHAGKAKCVAAADIVFCISEATARDLQSCYGIDDRRIVVTPLAADRTFTPDAPRPLSSPDDYLLFVGNRGGYKDFEVLSEAFSQLSADFPDLWLVAVGGGPFRPEEISRLTKLRIQNRVKHTTASDNELASLYAHAACFVFPSRYEGFGLPTVEAMSCGAPVVLARSSSHIEVGGEAAYFFAPGDAESLRRRLWDLLTDPARRSAAAGASLDQASHFTWAGTAAKTFAAYRTAIR